jgi:hypothetical protein
MVIEAKYGDYVMSEVLVDACMSQSSSSRDDGGCNSEERFTGK